jgi:hypothetical protein
MTEGYNKGIVVVFIAIFGEYFGETVIFCLLGYNLGLLIQIIIVEQLDVIRHLVKDPQLFLKTDPVKIISHTQVTEHGVVQREMFWLEYVDDVLVKQQGLGGLLILQQEILLE